MNSMQERDVYLERAGARLCGTACIPAAAGPFPTVLMLHGSGPLDRDENMAGQRLDIFNTLAHRFAESGFASVRYDKRGCEASTGDYYEAGFHDFVADAVGWFDALAEFDFCDPSMTFLLGHSEGCLVSAQVALERPTAAGIVALCPFIDGIESILMKQARQIEEELSAAPGVSGAIQRFILACLGKPTQRQAKLIAKVKSSDTATLRVASQRVPARWLRELMAVEPKSVLSQIRCPLLLIGGEKDLQCDPADVGKIVEIVESVVDAHVLSDMTHVLRRDDKPPTILGTSKLLAKAMDPVVPQMVEAWLGKQVAARSGVSATGTL